MEVFTFVSSLIMHTAISFAAFYSLFEIVSIRKEINLLQRVTAQLLQRTEPPIRKESGWHAMKGDE